LAAVVGCRAPVGVHQVSARVVHEQLTSNVLTDGRPSEMTRNTLRRWNLADRIDDDPEAALAELHQTLVAGVGARRELYALAELSFRRAEQTGRRDQFLASVVYAWTFLFPRLPEDMPTRFDPRGRAMCDIYNLALARAFATDEREHIRPQAGRMTLPFGTLDVAFDEAELQWGDRQLEDLVSVADLAVHGLRNRYRLSGLGAPAAAIAEPLAGIDPDQDLLGGGVRVPLTMLLRLDDPWRGFDGTPVAGRLEIHVQSDAEWTDIAGEQVPLEFESTAAFAAGLAESKFWTLELKRFFGRLSGLDDRPHLIAATPHRKGMIPVVFIHGTASSAGRWGNMFNDLWSERYMREHFEMWFFTYDTGNPVAYSSRALRRRLRRTVQRLDPNHQDGCLRQMVIVGHSQGGLLTKMTAIDSGDRLWRAVYGEPFTEVDLPSKDRRLVEEMMFMKPLPFVHRLVFIATPHGGSYQALRSISSWIGGFVSVPQQIAQLSTDLMRLDPKAFRDRMVGGLTANSINDMRPGNSFIEALRAIPVAPDVPRHSIVAVKGRGPVETGSDGVVKYESAHLSDADSELVVRSGHSTQSEAPTIQEVNRILRLHVRALEARGIHCGRGDAEEVEPAKEESISMR
jgi:pimeloyl-ACP methyl ester carboxylesterase